MAFWFQTIHHGEQDRLGLASELERFANDQWIGAHYSDDDAANLVMERFRKHLQQELELIELRVNREQE
jgi:predicted DNA-binding transcriptional regulator